MINKKGEFYLISSLILAVIIAGLTATINYAVLQPQPLKFYDLSEDYEAGTATVVDFGIYTMAEIKTRIDNFTKEYISHAQERDPNLGLIYVYGDQDGVTVANYGENPLSIDPQTGIDESLAAGGGSAISQISFEAGETRFSRNVEERMQHFRKIKTDLNEPGEWIRLEIAGVIHNFNLGDETQFLAILETTSGDETHIEVWEGSPNI